MTDIGITYFAVADPSDPTRIVYFRLSRRGLVSWPPEARSGPQPSDDPLADMSARLLWTSRVVASISAAPMVAADRFSVHKVRCVCCGRTLTDATSRSFSVGPECRAGFPVDVLAALAEEVGRLHASRGDLVPTPFDLFSQPEGVKA
jgi:hypothetical protein